MKASHKETITQASCFLAFILEKPFKHFRILVLCLLFVHKHLIVLGGGSIPLNSEDIRFYFLLFHVNEY